MMVQASTFAANAGGDLPNGFQVDSHPSIWESSPVNVFAVSLDQRNCRELHVSCYPFQPIAELCHSQVEGVF